MSSKPTILIVHGAWHVPAHMQPIRTALEKHGYATECPRLPTIGALPPISLMDDAQCIRDELTRLVDQDNKEVIVLAHSYGGVVSTQAIDASFAKTHRAEKGLEGGVLRLIYIAAFLLPLGWNLNTPLGGKMPPFITQYDDGTCWMTDPEDRFFSDLTPDQQKHWTSLLERSTTDAQNVNITQTAYTYVPLGYIYCELDHALLYPVQQKMVEGMEKARGSKVATETLKASHSPFLSMPEDTVGAVERIMASGKA